MIIGGVRGVQVQASKIFAKLRSPNRDGSWIVWLPSFDGCKPLHHDKVKKLEQVSRTVLFRVGAIVASTLTVEKSKSSRRCYKFENVYCCTVVVRLRVGMKANDFIARGDSPSQIIDCE